MEITLDVLLPHLSGVRVERVERTAAAIRVEVAAKQTSAACPGCGVTSIRIHSRYRRCLTDVAIGGHLVEIGIRVRRFFCPGDDCPAVTFVEQVDGLTSRHARRSPVQRQMLEAIGLALAGRAGARLASALGVPTSRSSMLRIIRAIPDPPPSPVRVLGVDDFAIRRGHRYGTVLVDLDSGRPIDLLPDREAATLAGWLRGHPEVEVVCRDRASAYAEAARDGAPQAIQVADRWHLWHNLAGHVEATVAQHRDCLRGPHVEPARPDHLGDLQDLAQQAQGELFEQRALVVRVRERHETIHAMLAAGKSIRLIERETGLARGTVRRYARADTPQALLAKSRDGRATILNDYKAHLHQRWNDGVTNASELFREITAMGYRGSKATVIEYLKPFRGLGIAPLPQPAALTVRQVTSWLLRRRADLTGEEQATLADIEQRCPQLAAVARHVTAFAEIMLNLHGSKLADWITAVEADDLPRLHSFAQGLQRDWDAVINGLTLPHSSGPVEGHVNRIKMIKRQMYGRANLDLLRKRVVHKH